MKRFAKVLGAVALMSTLFGCGSSSDATAKIGVIQYAEHPALDKAYEGFLKGLEESGYTYDENVTVDYKLAQQDQSNCKTITNTFVNDGVDLIYAIATPAAQAAANETKDIPVVISAVTDAKNAGLVKSNEKPGTNVTGVSDLTPVQSQLELLTQMLPEAKDVAILYCNAEDNSIFQANIAKEEGKKLGLNMTEATVTDSNQIQQVVESLIGKVDAIYIPTDNLIAEGMATVAQVANANNLPCICGERGFVTNGGLATYGLDYFELGRMAGNQAAEILEGEDPATMPIEYLATEKCSLTINKTAAKQLGITIPEDLAAKAEMVE